jgi:hypothetical protein
MRYVMPDPHFTNEMTMKVFAVVEKQHGSLPTAEGKVLERYIRARISGTVLELETPSEREAYIMNETVREVLTFVERGRGRCT